MKTFTLDEAQSLLPVLESLLKRAMEGRRAAQEVESELNELPQRIYLSGGMRVNSARVAKQRGNRCDRRPGKRSRFWPARLSLPDQRSGGSAVLAHGRAGDRALAHG